MSAPSRIFRASRLTKGNHLFPAEVEITPTSVTLRKRRLIGKPQPRHLPPANRKPSSGRFSYQDSCRWQLGQCDGGVTIDSPTGTRAVSTVANEPNTRPNNAARNARSDNGAKVSGLTPPL